MAVLNRYYVKNSELNKLEKILYNHVIAYNKNFDFLKLIVNGNYSLKIPSFVLNLRECILDRVV